MNMYTPVGSIWRDMPFHEAIMLYFCLAVSGSRGSGGPGLSGSSSLSLCLPRSSPDAAELASLPRSQPIRTRVRYGRTRAAPLPCSTRRFDGCPWFFARSIMTTTMLMISSPFVVVVVVVYGTFGFVVGALLAFSAHLPMTCVYRREYLRVPSNNGS